MKRITVANAVFERELASRRVADKYLEGLKRGVMCGGMLPLGYVSGETPGSAVLDKGSAVVVSKIFELCLNGSRPSEISKTVNKQYGGRPIKKLKNGRVIGGGLFTETQIKKILLNPFYAGYVYVSIANYGSSNFTYKLFDGVHEPIVSKEDWQKAVAILKSKQHKRDYPEIKNAKRFLLKKYLRCACGSYMTVASSGKKSRNGEVYRYYACTKKKHMRSSCDCQTHVPTGIIEGIVFACLGHFLKDEIRKAPIVPEPEYEAKVSSALNSLKRKAQKLRSELNVQLDIFTNFKGNAVVKKNIEERIRNIGDQIESNSKEQQKFKDELKVFLARDNISSARINKALEDLCALQENMDVSEKQEVLNLSIKKIVLKCDKRISKYKKEMSLRLFAKDEFVGLIPPNEVKFTLNTHSGISEWEILKPFKLSSSLRQRKKYLPQKRHWIYEVAKWQKDLEDSGESIRKYCADRKIEFSMFYRKTRLLTTLSSEVLKYLFKLKLKEETQFYSFRMLYELSKLPKSTQMENLKRC